jgi:hypothetical protein
MMTHIKVTGKKNSGHTDTTTERGTTALTVTHTVLGSGVKKSYKQGNTQNEEKVV